VISGRPIILTLSDYYLPGYRAGGPIRTLAGILEHLADEFLFKVITRDRDLGETEGFPQVTVNVWQTAGAAQIMYVPPSRAAMWQLRRLISSTEHDALYINSCFSLPFGIGPLLLRRCRLIPRRPVIIAPRGELASGALALNSGRKGLYIAGARLLGLTRGVIWQASGTHEAEDIRRSIGERARVVIAADLPAVRSPATTQRLEKRPGRLRLLFVSRVSRMKNLDGAVTLLQGVKGTVHFSIYGPIEDTDYWNRCQDLMRQLPPNVTVEYGGPVSPDRINDLMTQHDLLFLPTLGENFGHVILEAMASGSPVLISDRTRWRGLEAAGVGWDVPLDEPERFHDIIQRCLAMDSATWDGLSQRARRYAAQRQRDPEAIEQNRTLFRSAVERPTASV